MNNDIELKRCYPEMVGSYFDDEFMRMVKQIRKRIKTEKEREMSDIIADINKRIEEAETARDSASF